MTSNLPHSGQSEPSSIAPSVLGDLSSDAVLEHAEWLRRLARGLVRDIHDAEDLVQEAFGAVASARGPIRDLRAYLAQTLRFKSAKRFRGDSRRRRHEALSVDVDPEHEEPSDRVAERMDAMRLVLEEVGRLPAAQSRAIGLHYVDGLSVAEVATRLSLESSTVRSHLARGRAALRAKLDDECGGTEAWSLLLAPWCLPNVKLAGALSTSVSPTAPTAGTTLGGTAVGGFAIMTITKSLLVLVPILAAVGWMRLRNPEPANAPGSVSASARQGSLEREDDSAAALGELKAAAGRVALTGAEELRSPSTVARTFPVQGRIVRELDGAPLQGLEVSLSQAAMPSGDGETLTAITDANGEFLVPSKTWIESDAMVWVKDKLHYIGDQALTLAFPFEASIEVNCGPTFEFRYRGEYVDPREPTKVSIFSLKDSDPRTTFSTKTREGVLPWVRLTEPFNLSTAEARLEASGDYVFGHGWIDDFSGVDQGPIDIEFQEGGALEIHYGGGEPSSLMRVGLTKLDDPLGTPKELRFRSQPNEARKLAVETHLAAGRYQWDMRFGSTEESGVVEIKPGEWTRLSVGAELAVLMEATVEIDVSKAPGVDLGAWQIGAFFEADPTQGIGGHLEPVATEDPNRWTVTVAGLSEGKWVLFLKAEPGFEVSPMLVPLVPGGSPSQVAVTRAAEPSPVTLRLVDDQTGEPIVGGFVTHMDGLLLAALDECEEPLGEFGPHGAPSNRPSVFMVGAEGYKLTEWAFDPSQAKEAKLESGTNETSVEVRLERGWRSRLFVVDLTTQATVPGVSIHVDGEHVGKTDDDGCYWLTGTELPNEVVVARLNGDLEVVMNPFADPDMRSQEPPMGYPVMVRPR